MMLEVKDPSFSGAHSWGVTQPHEGLTPSLPRPEVGAMRTCTVTDIDLGPRCAVCQISSARGVGSISVLFACSVTLF